MGALFLFTSATAVAAEEKSDETSEESGPEAPGFKPRTLLEANPNTSQFASPVIKGTVVDGGAAMLIGGRGAALFMHSLGVGGGGLSKVAGSTDRSLAYGGLLVNYIFFSESLLHFDVGVMAGWGRSSEPGGPQVGIFVLEPEANLELNVTGRVRVVLGASYRHVAARGSGFSSVPGLTGLAGTFALRFGSF